MKSPLFLSLLFVFTMWTSKAQTSKMTIESPYSSNKEYLNPMPPSVRDISKTAIIDSGFVRILYALNATDITNPQTYDDLQRLEIGISHSKYYSLYVFNRDSTITNEVIEFNSKNNIGREMEMEDNVFITMIIEGKYQGWSEYLYSEYFKDFSKNEFTEYARMPENLNEYNSKYMEIIPVQSWEIGRDTSTIAGYLCQNATCQFRGRDYTAWFALGIPINNGPWKFGGLPGLILKVYDNQKRCTYECVKIENHKEKYPITQLDIYKRYKKTDRTKLSKLKKTIQENFYQLSGNHPENGKTFPKLYPYNPLELE